MNSRSREYFQVLKSDLDSRHLDVFNLTSVDRIWQSEISRRHDERSSQCWTDEHHDNIVDERSDDVMISTSADAEKRLILDCFFLSIIMTSQSSLASFSYSQDSERGSSLIISFSYSI